MQMQDLGFAREQIVTDAQTFHRVENLLDVARGDIVSQLSDGIVSCFDSMQDFDAQLKTIRVWLAGGADFSIEGADFCVEVPAVIIKWKFRGKRTVKRLDICKRQPFDVHKADHNISDLDPGVVDI